MIRKNIQICIYAYIHQYIYVCRSLAHMMPTATALCRRFAAFLICAASTQGGYSDDFAWHDATRWTCYNSKSRARQLAKGEPLRCGTLQAASTSARAVLNHGVDGRVGWVNLSQCRRIRKNMCNIIIQPICNK